MTAPDGRYDDKTRAHGTACACGEFQEKGVRTSILETIFSALI